MPDRAVTIERQHRLMVSVLPARVGGCGLSGAERIIEAACDVVGDAGDRNALASRKRIARSAAIQRELTETPSAFADHAVQGVFGAEVLHHRSVEFGATERIGHCQRCHRIFLSRARAKRRKQRVVSSRCRSAEVERHRVDRQHLFGVMIGHLSAAIDPEEFCPIRRHEIAHRPQQRRHDGAASESEAAELADVGEERGVFHWGPIDVNLRWLGCPYRNAGGLVTPTASRGSPARGRVHRLSSMTSARRAIKEEVAIARSKSSRCNSTGWDRKHR